jgi:hypothetical protein
VRASEYAEHFEQTFDRGWVERDSVHGERSRCSAARAVVHARAARRRSVKGRDWFVGGLARARRGKMTCVSESGRAEGGRVWTFFGPVVAPNDAGPLF